MTLGRAILIRKLRADLEDRELCGCGGLLAKRLRSTQRSEAKECGTFYVGQMLGTWVCFTFYHSATVVPLRVGLHKDHDFCPVSGYREVHTQIVGIGKMQQCRTQDLSSLYFEELMAPGKHASADVRSRWKLSLAPI